MPDRILGEANRRLLVRVHQAEKLLAPGTVERCEIIVMLVEQKEIEALCAAGGAGTLTSIKSLWQISSASSKCLAS